MPTPPAGYASAFLFLRDWLTAGDGVIPGLSVCRKRPDGTYPTPLPYSLPIVFPQVIGGSDNFLVVDTSTVNFDLLAADQDSAEALAAQLQRALLFTLPGYMAPDQSAWVKGVETVVKPTPRPYDNTLTGRFDATYRIAIRSRL